MSPLDTSFSRACMGTCVYINGGEGLVTGVFLDRFPPFFFFHFETRPLAKLGAHCWAGYQEAPPSPCLCLLSARIVGKRHHTWLLGGFWGSTPSILGSSPLPQPPTTFPMNQVTSHLG